LVIYQESLHGARSTNCKRNTLGERGRVSRTLTETVTCEVAVSRECYGGPS